MDRFLPTTWFQKMPSRLSRRLKHTPRTERDGASSNGNILTIKVDLSKEFGPSSSGKTIIIASTEGSVSVPDREEKIGLNVYKKK